MIKILIVDDEKPICDLIDLNLSASGYFCTAVQDGIKAIEMIERERFDLVLLDIMLPGADGYDVMEYIRPLKIPVIFITARHEVKDRVKGLKLGADDYLVKPFDVVELIAVSGSRAAAVSQNRQIFKRRRCDGRHRSAYGYKKRTSCGADYERIRTAGLVYGK